MKKIVNRIHELKSINCIRIGGCITFPIQQAIDLQEKHWPVRIFRRTTKAPYVQALIGGCWLDAQILGEDDYKIFEDHRRRFGDIA